VALTLVPFGDIQALLELNGSSLGEYPALEWIVDNVQAALEAFLGRELEQKERTEEVLLPASGTAQVPLAALPVRSVASVTVDGETEDNYQRTPYGIRLPAQRSAVPVEVTYTGGFDDSTLPAAIQRAAVYQAAYEYQAHEFVGAQAIDTEGGTVNRPELGLLGHVRAQLHPYIHPLRTVVI